MFQYEKFLFITTMWMNRKKKKYHTWHREAGGMLVNSLSYNSCVAMKAQWVMDLKLTTGNYIS